MSSKNRLPILPIILSFVSLVSGCAISPERMSELPDLNVCRSLAVFGFAGGAPYKQEIIRRNLLTQEEWALVAEGKISRGMSQCAMYVSWGTPHRENRSVGDWGVHIQHVYGEGGKYRSVSYVYTENGKVSSWQD